MEKKESIFSKLFFYAGNLKSCMILSCLFSGLSSIVSIVPFIYIWYIIREIFSVWPDVSQATRISEYGMRAMAYSVGSIAIYFASLALSHLAAFRVEKNMRKFSLHKIIYFPMGYLKNETSGRLRKVIDDNARMTHSLVGHQLPDLAGALVMPVAIFAVLFMFDWRLAIVCLIPLVFSMVFLGQMMGGERGKFMGGYVSALEQMNSSAVEYVRGIPLVKVFQQTVYSFKNFHEAIKNYSRFARDFSLACRIPMSNYVMSLNLSFILLTPVGLLLLVNSADPRAFLLDLVFYILFTPLCIAMMNKIMFSSESVMSARESIGRLEETLNVSRLPQSKEPREIGEYGIEFNDVVFKYPGNESPAVRNAKLRIPANKVYAIVGESGGGKSTMASLIGRLWDVDEGSISIGGVDVRGMEENYLMDQLGFVSQDSRLFKMSILENIKIGNPGASRNDILKAARLAQCSDILEKFPEGIDTMIGSKGVYMSGGEQQRICLARTILKDAPIVILDEATASSDPENEFYIQKAFESIVKGKTVLMIAHRLSTIVNADCILVMEKGRIVEQGSYEELMKKQGRFASMWEEYKKSATWKVGRGGQYA